MSRICKRDGDGERNGIGCRDGTQNVKRDIDSLELVSPVSDLPKQLERELARLDPAQSPLQLNS